MNLILLCTIPHSGTNFFHQMFRDAGYVTLGYGATKEKIHSDSGGRGWITRCHLSKDVIKTAHALKRQGATIVTTYRHFSGLRDSWKARSREVKDDLYARHDEWLELVRKVDPWVVTFEPLATRDKKIERLSKHLGVELTPDWGNKIGARK